MADTRRQQPAEAAAQPARPSAPAPAPAGPVMIERKILRLCVIAVPLAAALAANLPIGGARGVRAFSLVNHAHALTDAGRFDEAAAEAARAIALGSSRGEEVVDARMARAFALAELGSLDDALVEYMHAAEEVSSYGPAHRGVGDVLLRLGRAEEAIDPLRRAAEIDPADAVALNLLGSALGQSGRLGEALDALQRAVRIDPRRAEAWVNIGNVYLVAARAEEAAAAYRRALEIDPAREDAKAAIAEIERRRARPPGG